MDINWINTLLTSVTVFFASIVHGIAGFGLAQVSMGIMPFFRSTASAAAIFSMVAVVSNFRVWWSVRDSFDVMDWIKPVIGLIVGMPLGLFVFNQLNEAQLRIAVGVVLLIAVVFLVIGRQTDIMANIFKDKEYKPKWALPITVGFIAGILGGAVAIPGPAMILYGTFMASTGIWTKEKMKATFTAFFGVLMLYRVANVAVQGGINASLITEAAVTIPAMLLGVWVGLKIFEKIPSNIFNWVVIGLLTINAFLLLLT